MIEYGILIVMVVFAIGFGWLWVIEQTKRRKKRGDSAKRGGAITPMPDRRD
jgi:hypothetical protein